MNKRQRLEKCLAGEALDRLPTAVWRHFPGDDQRTADLARSIVDFQRQYDWDFVRVLPSVHYSVSDYGVQDEWRGSTDGARVVVRRPVQRSLDWTNLRPLDPTRGELGKCVDVVRMVCDGLYDDNAPVLATVYSPLAQAEQLAGGDLLLRHLRTHPDRLASGLNALTESTLRLLDLLRRLPIGGIFYVVHHATYDLLTEQEFRTFGIPYDRKVLELFPEKWTFNVLSLRGEALMFKLCGEAYPVQAVHWTAAEPDLALGKTLIRGAVCGGLTPDVLAYGTPTRVRESMRDAALRTNARRCVLGAAAPLTTPLSNLRGLREMVAAL